MAVTGVPLSDLAAIASSGWSHVEVAVADTASNIAADLASNNSVLLANSAAESGVTLTSGGVIAAATLTAMAALPNFQTAGCPLTVHDSAVAILSLNPTALSLAYAIDVADTGSMIEASLDTLQNTFNGALTISLTDPNPALVVTAGQYSNDRTTIDAVTTPGVFTVDGSAASLAAIASSLASDAAISTVAVTDSAFDVISNLPALSVAGSKLRVLLSDTSITANLVTPLLGIANLSPAGLPVVDIGSQIAAVAESGSVSALAYLNTYGASLSSDSVVSAADAAALENLTSFNKAGHALVVWDTAQHLSSPAYATALSNASIDSVHLKTTGGTVSVTALQAAALFSITGFSTNNPSGMPNTLVVSDTAAHIEAELPVLTGNAGQIAAIVVNSSAVVSDQVLSDLQGLGATAAAGTSLSVRDTAGNIAAHALSQATGHSISPVSWAISGSSMISQTDAEVLGGLSHFSTGPFTLTLNLNANTSLSIADANKLGTLAGALNLSGYQLDVAGSAANLSALSSGALQIVTPQLIDTAANIAALPATSPLLQGTVEVIGGETLSAATASALLNLVHAGAGSGIAVNTLSFDHVHVIADTVSNLRSLTSSAGWVNNVSTHSAFQLAAQDSVANLIDPGNHSYLSTLTSTTLLGDATISGAAADALATAAAAIHFDRGSFHITVQDTASNLVDPSNTGGIAIADAVKLAGPDHVDAMDAETLLSINHLNLTTSLTIADSSVNLLDGTLAPAIANSGFGSHITVQLAGPETLDAQTAESLVSVAGFSDVHNLTIADDPSYLLDSANLSAEQMAVQVTLPNDELISANTVLRLSELPHFTPGTAHLLLASNDFADAATLKAIADMGGAFDANGHGITVTADALNLTPAEFAALQLDNVSLNNHLVGVTPDAVSVTETSNVVHVSGSDVAGSTIKIYAADGSIISSGLQTGASFSVNADDLGHGHNFSLTESGGGVASEGAPLVILDSGLVESSVAAAGGSFASTGQLQVDTGKFVNLYQSRSIPVSLAHAALVYDPVAHTIALDIPGQGSTTLITLGGSTHPAGLEASEILFKLHG